MLKLTRTFFFSLTIIAVLLFSAMGPTTVYADDGSTASTSSTDTSVSGSDSGGCDSDEGEANTSGSGCDSEDGVTDPQPTETAAPVVVETTPTPPGDSQPTEPVVDQTAPPADSIILEQIPDNTTVTVLDADGQPQPLATQDAANAIAITSDPIWCPQGQSPTPDANGCTSSFSSFNALLTELSGNTAYQGAGTIYVQQGTYSGGETSIDFNSASYDLSNIRNFDLTVHGGWDTITNTVDPASTSTFSIPFVIGTSTNPWGGSLTINNIVINNSNQTALTLYSQNDINLSNVQVSNSVTGSGAELNAGRDITINNSKFERNRNAGAVIRAGGNVAIANSTFSNPGRNRLQMTGLDIVTTGGSVALLNVQANGNREVGANINAAGRVTIGSSFFSGTKSFTTAPGGAVTYYGYGLQVVTPDAIDLDGVTASDNFLWGASLDAGKDVAIANSIFNANTTASTAFIDDTGLLVKSGGQVALNNVQANDNRLIGATIDAAGTVSINNSTFSNNKGTTISSTGVPTFHGYGLEVVSLDSIALDNVIASNNNLFGASLDAGVDVFIANSTFSNNSTGSATDPLGRGLEVVSAGDVFLDTVVVDNNQLFGANIQAAGDVFLDTVTATNNGTDGVVVDATCANLINGTYSGNGQYGLNLINPALNQIGSPIFAGNGAGDIFPPNPGPCIVASSITNSGIAGNNNSAGSSNASLSAAPLVVLHSAGTLDRATVASESLLGNSLNNVLAKTWAGNNGFIFTTSIFTGKYAYVYSTLGMQVVLLYPISLTDATMDGS